VFEEGRIAEGNINPTPLIPIKESPRDDKSHPSNSNERIG
jgi:hypothetical protein